MKKKKEKKKKFLVTISILVIFLFLIIGFLTMKYLKNETIHFKEKITIHIGEPIPKVDDFIIEKKKIESSLKWDNLKEENNKTYYTGTYNGEISYKKKKVKVQLIVKDEIAPTITGVKDITILEKDEVNILQNIETTDNSHDEIKLEVIGEYDTTLPGEYSLSYEATDKGNNKTSVPFKLIVKKKGPVTSKGYSIEKRNGLYYIKGILIANKSYPLTQSYQPNGLTKETNSALEKMKQDAKKEGIYLNLISGYRSYDRQATIYNNYVNKDGKQNADTYSARPGHSEHQTGLAFDLNSLNTSFGRTKEGIWLSNNCYKYGFILRYPKGKETITGYIYEPWHLRYIGEEAKNLYNNGNWITLEEYLGITSTYQN